MAAIAAVLFVIGSAGDVFGRHLCAHHDGPIAVQLTQTASVHDAHGAAALEAAHVDRDSHGSDAHGCTCVGDCAGAPTTVVPTASEVLQAVAASGEQANEPAYDALIARQRPPHFLPYSNGPPILV